MEEAAAPGSRSARMARLREVLLLVALVLTVCVRGSHGVTDSQDSEYLVPCSLCSITSLRDEVRN
jgi:hypothetical protein